MSATAAGSDAVRPGDGGAFLRSGRFFLDSVLAVAGADGLGTRGTPQSLQNVAS